jgi:hypothetical protein
LNLKDCNKITDEAFQDFSCPNLLKLNVAFIRAITSKSLLKVVSVAKSLAQLDVNNCPNILGGEKPEDMQEKINQFCEVSYIYYNILPS